MDGKTTKGIIDAMNTDLAKSKHYLLMARTNMDRAKHPLAHGHPDLWEEARGILADIDALIEKVKKEQS
jgi:hypothetical protein